uniref:Stabilizer of axonemal microtubules 1 n=1 Tax=Megaselia scalaris TaxID=36166 RepID=T1GL73_MEGSC
MDPVKAQDNFHPFQGRMDTNTVQKLSYVPHCGARPADLIKPPKAHIQFCGPQATITTQKHDFVPKPFCLRQPIIPQSEGMPLKPNSCSKPPEPIRQPNSIQRACGPAETCTVQKLSYLPVDLPRKEDLPWAKKERLCPPPYLNLCTTYGLSYMPNCNAQRERPIYPAENVKMFDGPAPNCTVYKLSYTCSNGQRSSPIYPKPQIESSKGPVSNCTVYKLSYAPNCGMEMTKPIRPSDNYRKPCAPIQKITTQKHDFVPKPSSKRQPIVPQSMIMRSSAPLDNCTVNKLSYLPVDVCSNPPPAPIKPCSFMDKISGPAPNCTTYKLSYLPVCLPPKAQTPWANVSNVEKSCAPMEKCTIQKLSYMPPGSFNSQPCSCKANAGSPDGFPKAGIAIQCHPRRIVELV